MIEKTTKKINPRQAKQEKIKKELETLEEKSAHPENYSNVSNFDDLPISFRTKEGLKRSSFRQMTEVQKKGIPLALAKRDVLGAAKTGSGKTLAFLIPVLEILYRARWNKADGLGALIISPTRELAVQIFEVLRKIGREHSFSAGIIIGGKDFRVEQERVSHMNILVATPGRLLQHMDQSVGFNCDNLQVLVLDEADRIMDMGFEKTVNAIIDNLPTSRQTLLFSATQTRSVKDLARLSLRDPEYIAVHEKAEHSTPKKLSQHYVVCELHEKLDILYSFIKTHLKAKIIVFVSSCKQARFVYECFCRLQPGISLMHLHGKQKQTKRVEVFRKFTSTDHAVLFCTDIAARGLDFPAVDWVLQLDCPEDAATYIHRVGRTARFDANGHALLMLLPTEKDGMLEELTKKKVPIEEIKIRASKKQTIQKQLQSFCFQDPEIKYLGQRAFVSYMRSVYLQKNKNIFKVAELPADAFAHALGLAGTPKIKFVKKAEKKATSKTAEPAESETEKEGTPAKGSAPRTKYDRMFERKNQDILSEHYNKLVDFEGDKVHSDEEDFLTLQRVDHELESDSEEELKALKTENISKRQLKMSKKERAKRQGKGEKIVFDEEGNPHQIYEMIDETEFLKAGDPKTQKEAYMMEEAENLKSKDFEDKLLAKQKRREKRLKRKQREKEERLKAAARFESGQSDFEQSDYDQSEDESADDMETDNTHTGKRSWDVESDEEEQPKKRVVQVSEPTTLEDQEALALKLLGGL